MAAPTEVLDFLTTYIPADTPQVSNCYEVWRKDFGFDDSGVSLGFFLASCDIVMDGGGGIKACDQKENDKSGCKSKGPHTHKPEVGNNSNSILMDGKTSIKGYTAVEIASLISNISFYFTELNVLRFFRSRNQLSKKNVKSRLTMKMVNSDPSALFDLSASLPNKMKTLKAGLVAASKDDEWIKYRLTASSTPSLIMSAKTAMCALSMTTDADYKAVSNAILDPTELSRVRLIDKKMVTYTAAYLTASSKFPDGWYMGEKAKDDCDPASWKHLIILFKAFNKVSTTEVKDDASMDDLKAIGANYKV